MNRIPLILLSGMGADERVFAGQRDEFPQLVVPRWIAPLAHETLASYAQRFARAIDPGTDCYIGGASFGGFVAIEMARHLPHARACFLNGSSRSPAEQPRPLRMMRSIRGLAPWLPFGAACRFADIGVSAFGAVPAPSTRAFFRQLSDSDAAFLRWASEAVLGWEVSDPPDVPIHHIHGASDHVLPVGLVRADVIVAGAGHILSMTHPREVNAFLRERM
jgi:pimeloyl-ACP methyl ester carboxylesterase